MDIFLPRLSSITTQTELQRVVNSALTRKFHFPFTETPKLEYCTVLEMRDNQGGVERHGHLRILPNAAAKWFIRHSREFRLHRKRLLSRRYFTRLSDTPSNQFATEDERRRPSLKIKSVKRTPLNFEKKSVRQLAIEL
ncbi:MAG: hypothetical protein JKX92_15655 [Porticoccaceae bacterium]|nr:hypothetical protein [Porticoccaceae bacterium]